MEMQRIINTQILTFAGTIINNKKYYFNNDPQINAGYFNGLIIPNFKDLSPTFSYNNGIFVPVSYADFLSSFITLVDKDRNLIIDSLPFSTFSVFTNNGKLNAKFWSKIALEKSYIKFTTSTASNVFQNFSFIITEC